MALRWGIASAGTISFDFANALSTLPATDHVISAVGARNLSSAKDFARKFDIPTYHEGYESLARDENVGKWMNEEIISYGNLSRPLVAPW